MLLGPIEERLANVYQNAGCDDNERGVLPISAGRHLSWEPISWSLRRQL